MKQGFANTCLMQVFLNRVAVLFVDYTAFHNKIYALKEGRACACEQSLLFVSRRAAPPTGRPAHGCHRPTHACASELDAR